MEDNNINNGREENVEEIMDNEVIQVEETTNVTSEEIASEVAERVEERVGDSTEALIEEVAQEDQVESFTEKLIPFMNKAEKNIRKGVSSARDFAKKANDEYIAPTVEKVGASVQDGKAKDFARKLNPKILAIGGVALLVIIILVAVVGRGGNDSEKVALRFVQALSELNQSEIRKVVEPRVIKHIENASTYNIFSELSSEEEKYIKELRKETNVSYTTKEHVELSEYELDRINEHFCDLLGIDSFGAKEAISYTVNIIGRSYGQKIDENVEIVLMKVSGKWYVAQVDGSWIDYI